MKKTRKRTRRLGQHLLVDSQILSRIVNAAKISKQETVCEIGAGTGSLTAELCKVAGKVIAFELDPRMFEFASKTLCEHDNLALLQSDAFKAPRFDFDVLVSNLPYSRSRDAIEWLACSNPFRVAVIMIQNEFAAKLVARPGQKEYRTVSVLGGYCFKTECLFDVPRQSFKPIPSVDSVVIRLTPIRTVNPEIVKAVNFLFSFKNKKVSAVAARFKGDSFKTETSDDRRVDKLSPDEVVRLALKIKNVRSL